MVTMQRQFSRYRKQYLVLEAKGLEFVETWFGTPKCVPPDLTKLYQLLLHMVTMKGTVPVYLALKIGYTIKVIDEAVMNGYVESSPVPKKPSKEILKRIKEIIGKPPREMYG
jgi:hypothetical protein